MKEMNVLGVKVVAHNKREESLVNILNNVIDDARRYLKENTFGTFENSYSIAKRNLKEVNTQFCCLYYMGCTKEPHLYDQIEAEFGFSII